MSQTSGNMSVMDYYDHLWSIRDKRVDGWFLMDSPWPTVTMSLLYVYSVKMLGPSLMKDRPAFQLRGTILLYNVFQVAISAYVVYESWMAGWGTHYSWTCQRVEQSADPNSVDMRMARACYCYFLCKFTEFFDTWFFIARKNFKNVSVLQVFHHGIMPCFTYAMVRWLPGGHESFGALLNSLIHVIMYTYYFLAMLGPQMQPYLWWKKYLTAFQIFQFCLISIKSWVVILGIVKCGYPWQFSAITAALMVCFLGLFSHFFINAYLKGPSGKKKTA